MAIIVKPIAEASLTTTEEIAKVLKAVLSDLEDQLNQNAIVHVSTNGVIPAGLERNSVLFVSFKGRISLYIQGAKTLTQLTAEMLGGLSKQGTQYLGHLTGTVDPVVANFPIDNDWGFFTNSTTPTTFICYNVNGILKKTTMP